MVLEKGFKDKMKIKKIIPETQKEYRGERNAEG